MAVFLFFGDDTYSQREKLKFWYQEFEKKHGGDMNIATIDGESATANEIFQASCAMPFLAEKRLTIVKNFLSGDAETEVKSAMAEMLDRIPDCCVLVFSETLPIDRRLSLYKKIQKLGKIVEFPLPTGSRLLGWIDKQVAQLGGKIEGAAQILLSELIPNDLFRLGNEINKLVNYANGRPITKNDVELLVNSQLATSIFKLTDGIGQKNKKIAVDTLHQLIETGEELHGIFYMIMRQFRIIMCAKDLGAQGVSKEAMASKIGEHPFAVSNAFTQSRNFSIEQLKRAYELLVRLDTKLKSGGIKVLAGDNREFVLALDRLVLELCG